MITISAKYAPRFISLHGAVTFKCTTLPLILERWYAHYLLLTAGKFSDFDHTSRSNTLPRTPSITVRLWVLDVLFTTSIFAHRALAHSTDVFSLSTTASQILSSSGSSSIKVHSTNNPDYPLFQTLDDAHKLGCHHIATSRNGRIAASVGFGGEVKVWAIRDDGRWREELKIVGAASPIPKLSPLKRLEC